MNEEAPQRRRGRGRPKGSFKGRTPRFQFSVDLPSAWAERVEEAIKDRGMSRAEWVREAILYFLDHDPLSSRNIMKKLREECPHGGQDREILTR